MKYISSFKTRESIVVIHVIQQLQQMTREKKYSMGKSRWKVCMRTSLLFGVTG